MKPFYAPARTLTTQRQESTLTLLLLLVVRGWRRRGRDKWTYAPQAGLFLVAPGLDGIITRKFQGCRCSSGSGGALLIGRFERRPKYCRHSGLPFRRQTFTPGLLVSQRPMETELGMTAGIDGRDEAASAAAATAIKRKME